MANDAYQNQGTDMLNTMGDLDVQDKETANHKDLTGALEAFERVAKRAGAISTIYTGDEAIVLQALTRLSELEPIVQELLEHSYAHYGHVVDVSHGIGKVQEDARCTLAANRIAKIGGVDEV